MGITERLKHLSWLGLVLAVVFAGMSLTPSLIPRNFLVQGILTGLVFSVGYALGRGSIVVLTYFELPAKRHNNAFLLALASALLFFGWSCLRTTTWANELREIMGMEAVTAVFVVQVVALASVVILVCFSIGAGVKWLWRRAVEKITHVLPGRAGALLSFLSVILVTIFGITGGLANLAVDILDGIYFVSNRTSEEGVEQPVRSSQAGSDASLITWDKTGKWGQDFIVSGPSREDLKAFGLENAQDPIRIYGGLELAETESERVDLVLTEMDRVGAFDRSILVLGTPTGTGWLDPGAVDALEYIHAGDTAIVGLQYSYTPSWMTILLDPNRSKQSSKALFDAVYDRWTKMDAETRPKLYLFGLSLGSMGSEAAASHFATLSDPIDGALRSGPPFPSDLWRELVASRTEGSPIWLPRVGDGSLLRFTGRESSLRDGYSEWANQRYVYIQHASDPMSWFGASLLYARPDWLSDEGRAEDISQYFDWYPVVTFFQVLFDIPISASPPYGFGHSFLPSSYVDAWLEVIPSETWTNEQTRMLKTQLDAEVD
ncbi:alpha/beta hydrolase [Cognatishimia activa]|uniref:alpha/beta hydrolase n=1 Tax=Cognatishimia activa TaxID=1715691 RepID=UPI00222E7DE5|nr:alpha/beta-hydrolase family protein [Cognatishimia activa]UZD90317.1 alpha/beta-hydrolase family protein [Cognatishimia activa]